MTLEELIETYCKGWTVEQINDFLGFLKLWLEAPEEKRTAAEQFIYACEAGCTTKEAIDRVENAEIREEMTNIMTAQA